MPCLPFRPGVTGGSCIDGSMRTQMREISGGSSYASQNAPEAHFGLRDATVVDTVRIEWPSGLVQELHNVPARQILTVPESVETPPPVRPTFTEITRLVDGKARFVIKGENGKSYRIDISSDLTDWSMLQSIQVTNADGSREFVDETGMNAPVRFYRLLVAP